MEISRRIEAAETEVRKIIYSLGFAGKEHIALTEKLLADPPRERFDRVVLDKKVDSRDAHLALLRRLLERLQTLDKDVDDKYIVWHAAHGRGGRRRALMAFKRGESKVAGHLPEILFQAEGHRGNGARR